MAGGTSPRILGELTELFGSGTVAAATDEELLDRFREGPAVDAEAAFAALVRRHGPMVRRACGSLLDDANDVDDVAQATFLVLARSAGSVRRPGSVASWLYGTACRIAARLKADAARRRARERRGAERASRGREGESHDDDWQTLYEELGRLPERFRLAIVLFHLEGCSYEETARRVGCPIRTVQGRLARGRERLRVQLARRGEGPATAQLLAAFASPDLALPTAWAESTTTAAVRFAAGGTVSATMPTTAAILAQGALRAMSRESLRRIAGAVLLLGFVAAGGLVTAARSAPKPDARATGPDDRYRVTLDAGATIEVVGVSRGRGPRATWWKPDGTPLAVAPAEIPDQRLEAPDRTVRSVLIRVAGLAPGATFKWLPSDVADYWGGRPTKGGERVAGLEYYTASFPRDRTTCSARFRVAAGPWDVEVEHDGSGGFSTYNGPTKFYFGKARGYQGGTAIAVAQNIIDRDSRVVAVDHRGRVHPPVYSSGGGAEILSLLDVEFPIPPDQIRSYQVQSRPFSRAEITGIALHPRVADE